MNAKRNAQINLAVAVLVLLAVRVEPAAAIAGLADWEEHLAGRYYLARGPGTRSPTRNVVSIVRKEGETGFIIVEDVIQYRCCTHGGIIIGMTTEGGGFLIDIHSGEVLVAGETDVKQRARSLGVPTRVCERVFGWRLRPTHIFLGLSVGLAFSMLAVLLFRRIRRRSRNSIRSKE